MNKIATIFTLAVFLISIMPISIAQDLTDEQKRLSDLREDRLKAMEEQQKEADDVEKDRLKVLENRIKDSDRILRDVSRPTLIRARLSKDDLLKERKFTDLRKEKFERVRKLDERKIEKLSGLRQDQITKLTEDKESRLRMMVG